MKVGEVTVSYGRKYPCGKYASEFVNLNMKVTIEGDDPAHMAEQVRLAYDQCRQLVEEQIEARPPLMAEWE
jgi:very-short-patch-repair endonuclease